MSRGQQKGAWSRQGSPSRKQAMKQHAKRHALSEAEPQPEVVLLPSDIAETRKEGDVRLIKIAFCPDQNLNSLEELAQQASEVDSKTKQGEFWERLRPCQTKQQ